MIDLFSCASIQMHARVKHFPSFNSIVAIYDGLQNTALLNRAILHRANARTSRLYSSGATFSFLSVHATAFRLYYLRAKMCQRTHLKQIKRSLLKSGVLIGWSFIASGMPREIPLRFCVSLKGRNLFKGSWSDNTDFSDRDAVMPEAASLPPGSISYLMLSGLQLFFAKCTGEIFEKVLRQFNELYRTIK